VVGDPRADDDPTRSASATPDIDARIRAKRRQEHLANVARLGRELADAEAHLQLARRMLDGAILRAHEDLISVAALADAAGLSRESAYRAMDRARERGAIV
jgi:hypothetical protein